SLRPAPRTEPRVVRQRRVATAAGLAALRGTALRAETRIRRIERAAARTGELAQRHVATGLPASTVGRRLPAPAIAIAAARIVAAMPARARAAVMPATVAAVAVPAAMATAVAAQDSFQKAHRLLLNAWPARRRTPRRTTAAANRWPRRSGLRPRRRRPPSTS